MLMSMYPGRVYRATDTLYHEDVAVKVEPCNFSVNQLENEEEVYNVVRYSEGFPIVHWFGRVKDVNFLVLDLLGSSLGLLFHQCGKRFSPKTVLLVGLQAVSCLPVM